MYTKSVERFSGMMNFNSLSAEITVFGERINNPTKIDAINYKLKLKSNDLSLNINLLKKNIENYGTISIQ